MQKDFMNDNKKISADLLKWIALITMFLDHIGAGILEVCYMPDLYEVDIVIRSIGRIAFPIYCFLLVEGYKYTRSRFKYAVNLLIFALISELPFDMLFRGGISMDYQNVYFTLLFGLVAIIIAGLIEENEIPFAMLWELLIAATIAYAAYLINTDYDAWGVLLIFVIFVSRNKPRWVLCVSTAAYVVLTTLVQPVSSFIHMSQLEAIGIVSFILIFFYNGKRSGKINKYVFYSLYPGHIALYCGIRYLLML